MHSYIAYSTFNPHFFAFLLICLVAVGLLLLPFIWSVFRQN